MEDVSFSSPLTNSNDTEIKDPQSFLKDIRINNINRHTIGQLNINSLRNKERYQDKQHKPSHYWAT